MLEMGTQRLRDARAKESSPGTEFGGRLLGDGANREGEEERKRLPLMTTGGHRWALHTFDSSLNGPGLEFPQCGKPHTRPWGCSLSPLCAVAGPCYQE